MPRNSCYVLTAQQKEDTAMRRHLIQIPTALPAKLGAPKARPSAFIDHVHAIVMGLYDREDDERAVRFRGYINTVDSLDAQTGCYKGDMILAAVCVKDEARDKGIFPDIVAAKENTIASKFQFCLRRHDTDEVAFSRSRRLKLLAAPSEPDLEATGAA
jgi:hypothetical protein